MVDCHIDSCCHRRGREAKECPLEGPDDRDRSLVVASLELGRELADRGRITFRVYGTCMLPCIWSGDMLTVVTRPVEEISEGDIVVFRRNSALFAHRVILKGVRDGKPYVVSQPDRSEGGDDGPLFDNDILGIVGAIRRHDVDQPLDRQRLRGRDRLHAQGAEWLDTTGRPLLSKAFRRLCQQAWYREIAKRFLDIFYNERRCVVRVPLSADQTNDLYRLFPAGEFDLTQPLWRREPAKRWVLDVLINDDSEVAGSSLLAWHPPDCPRGSGWWVEETIIRPRYLGAGLEETLHHEAEAILTRAGLSLQEQS